MKDGDTPLTDRPQCEPKCVAVVALRTNTTRSQPDSSSPKINKPEMYDQLQILIALARDSFLHGC
jgi:hypothetical protein